MIQSSISKELLQPNRNVRPLFSIFFLKHIVEETEKAS